MERGVPETYHPPVVERREQLLDEVEFEKNPLDGFAGSCAPDWLAARARDLKGRARSLTKLLVTGAALSAPGSIYASPQETLSEAAFAEEHEAKETVARFEAVFQKAADEIRRSRTLEQDFTIEEVEQIAVAVDTYPVGDVLDVLSRESGLTLSELGDLNRLELVDVYAEQGVRSAYEEAKLSGDASDSLGQEVTQALERGGMNVNGRSIFINASELSRLADSPDDLREKIHEVMTHELLHSFPHESFANDPRGVVFYEGMTEAMTNRVHAQLNHAEIGAEDEYYGYGDGPTAAAEVLLTMTDSGDAVSAYLTGDGDFFSDVFDERYGKGTFDRAIQYTDPEIDFSVIDAGTPERTQTLRRYITTEYDRIAPLYGLLSVMSTEAPAAIAEANERLSTGKIQWYEGDYGDGLVLLSDRTKTGFANGFIRHESDAGEVQLVFFPLDRPAGDAFVHPLSENVALLFDNVPTALPTGSQGIDQATPDDRGKAFGTVLARHADVLDTYFD